jgi:hypothetical protein
VTTTISDLREIMLSGGPVEFRGALEAETTDAGVRARRLPAWTKGQYQDPSMELQALSPSGVRLAFRTAATVIELDVLTTVPAVPSDELPLADTGLFELVIDGSTVEARRAPMGDLLMVEDPAGRWTLTPGEVGTLRFEGLAPQVKDVEIWLPHWVPTRVVTLRADADVEPPAPTGRRVWIHHGSSISQCNSAATPTGIWPAVAAKLGGVDVVNLGLSGNCFLDPFVARSIRDAPADLISLKLGINLMMRAAFRLRTFGPAVHGFLDTVREGHPDVPLLVVSPIACPKSESTPGPSVWIDDELHLTGDPADVARGALTLEVVRAELERIVGARAKTDPNIHYLDGLELFGPHDAHRLPDGLHPDADDCRLIGHRFAALAFAPGGPLAA